MKYLAIVLCLILAGCGARTTGKNICPDIRIDVRDSSNVTISPGLETLSSGGTPVTSQQPTTYNVSPDVNLSLTPQEQLVAAGKSLAAATIEKEATDIAAEIIPVLKPDKPKIVVPVVPSGVMEEGKFSKRHPINNRPYWYFDKKMSEYPADFDIIVEGCGTVKVRGNDGTRIDWDENLNVVPFNESRDRWFLRQSTIPNDPRNMVLVAPQGCMADKGDERAYIPTHGMENIEWINLKSLPGGSGRVFTWLDKPGKEYPEEMQVVINEITYNITNTNKKWTADGNLKNHNQFVYFPGDWPGQDTNNGLASIVLPGPGFTGIAKY